MSEKKPYVVILGGTSGLGAAIAEEYEARGKGVIVLGTSGQSFKPLGFPENHPLHIMKRPWPPTLADRMSLRTNLRYEEDTWGAAHQVNDLIKRNDLVVEAVVWAAGKISRRGFPSADDMHLIDVNIRNPLKFIAEILPGLSRQEVPFTLVVISSTTGVSTTPKPEEAVYAATKAAQVSFARAVGSDPENHRMKVALFCPGGMQTPFWKNEPGVDTSVFLDPKRVAAAIVADVENQTEPYYERVIPRGSL